MPKSFTWLRSIEKATFYDNKTSLLFLVFRNPEATSIDDKFFYRCTDSYGKLMFERKISFAVAIVVINSWRGKPGIQRKTPAKKGRSL